MRTTTTADCIWLNCILPVIRVRVQVLNNNGAGAAVNHSVIGKLQGNYVTVTLQGYNENSYKVTVLHF